eukprot:PhF_6_TR6815/c0_g1_i1/m.9806
MSILAFIDRSSKWVVSISVALTAIIATTTLPPPYEITPAVYIALSLWNATFSKILKRIINSARPPGSRKVDPGMPSSHAMSLGYLTAGAVSGALWLQLPYVVCVGVTSVGMLFAGLRVYMGHHTIPQVIVGYVVGWCHFLCLRYVDVQYVRVTEWSQRSKEVALSGCVVVCVLYAVTFSVKWL